MNGSTESMRKGFETRNPHRARISVATWKVVPTLSACAGSATVRFRHWGVVAQAAPEGVAVPVERVESPWAYLCAFSVPKL